MLSPHIFPEIIWKFGAKVNNRGSEIRTVRLGQFRLTPHQFAQILRPDA